MGSDGFHEYIGLGVSASSAGWPAAWPAGGSASPAGGLSSSGNGLWLLGRRRTSPEAVLAGSGPAGPAGQADRTPVPLPVARPLAPMPPAAPPVVPTPVAAAPVEPTPVEPTPVSPRPLAPRPPAEPGACPSAPAGKTRRGGTIRFWAEPGASIHGSSLTASQRVPRADDRTPGVRAPRSAGTRSRASASAEPGRYLPLGRVVCVCAAAQRGIPARRTARRTVAA